MTERVTDTPRLISVFDGLTCVNSDQSKASVLYVLNEGGGVSYWVVDRKTSNNGKFRMRQTDESGKPSKRAINVPASQQIFNNLLVIDPDGLKREFWGKDRSINDGQSFKLPNLIEGRSERDTIEGLPGCGCQTFFAAYQMEDNIRL